MSRDWYPQGVNARAAWHGVWAANLPGMAAKYNLSAAMLAEVAADNAWTQYWARARHQARTLTRQLNRYYDGIAGNDTTIDPPVPINFALPPSPPPEVPPGIEHRTREIARHIRGNASFSRADGALLGILTPARKYEAEDELFPKLKITAIIPNKVRIAGSMKERDAVRIEYQPSGGSWATIAFLTRLPAELSITPQNHGQPEAGQIRAIFVHQNEPYGNYSASYPIVIA